jgi:hypothetical protein
MFARIRARGWKYPPESVPVGSGIRGYPHPRAGLPSLVSSRWWVQGPACEPKVPNRNSLLEIAHKVIITESARPMKHLQNMFGKNTTLYYNCFMGHPDSVIMALWAISRREFRKCLFSCTVFFPRRCSCFLWWQPTLPLRHYLLRKVHKTILTNQHVCRPKRNVPRWLKLNYTWLKSIFYLLDIHAVCICFGGKKGRFIQSLMFAHVQ